MSHFNLSHGLALCRFTKMTREIVSLFGVLVLAAPANSVAAAACQVQTVSSVNFGAYDVFSTSSNYNGIGSLVIKCSGGASATVKLSSGQSNTFSPRVLRSGTHALNYNLYISAARTIVWGDGTGGTSLMTVQKNRSANLDIFGGMPAGQDAAVGLYTDTIIMTVEF